VPRLQSTERPTKNFVAYLVDDDPAVLKALTRLLYAAGYKVKAYRSPDQFLSKHDPSPSQFNRALKWSLGTPFC
jgi:hypothetical protein